ncbi:MAG: M23 family metallopeptidase [Oscillospiraceae bacterium]|nr:M23 family metallopeptidase [Oscillospiraceae bacterium]
MKELKIKTKLQDFFTNKGFFLSLAISLTLIGSTIWVVMNKSIDNTITKSFKLSKNTNFKDLEDSENLERVDNIVSNIPIEPDKEPKISVSKNLKKQNINSKDQNLSESDLNNNLEDNQENILFVPPVSGKIINDFSNNELVKNKTLCDWRVHNGIDISAPQGTPIKAIADGEVIKIYSCPILGICVEIEHANNINSIYCGLNKNLNIKEGDSVEAADVIGSIGNTAAGESELGPHLHLEIKENGEKINPLSKIKIY